MKAAGSHGSVSASIVTDGIEIHVHAVMYPEVHATLLSCQLPGAATVDFVTLGTSAVEFVTSSQRVL